MTVSKRQFLAFAAAQLALTRIAASQSTDAQKQEAYHDMMALPPNWMGQEQIAFVIYPGFTALDMVGPHYMLSGLLGSTVHIVAKTREPVVSDAKLTFVPTATFEECPDALDIVCVPGGTTGTLAAMRDDATLSFLKTKGAKARYVTSVCTGSLVLAAAGLLEGYRATSHWAALNTLSEFGATPVAERVVVDRNRVTGAGVTAGVDFGLTLLAIMRDRLYAECMQLLAEYDPQPPFAAGSLDKAPKQARDIMQPMLAPFAQDVAAVAAKIKSVGR